MLGIALIIMLGFFLYHYRPRNLETKLKRSLFWSELGKACLICQPIFLVAFQCAHFIFMVLNGNINLQNWMEYHNLVLYPFERAFFGLEGIMNTFLYVFPVISAWLIQKKLVKPLSGEKVPRKSLFHLIGLFSTMPITGFFSVYFVQLLFWGTISVFGYGIMLQAFLSSLPIFSILLIGVGAVEMAGHNLRKYSVDQRLTLPV